MNTLTVKTSDYTLPIEIPGLRFYRSTVPFELEKGGVLPELTITYHTYGKLNAERDNVIWVCHALTANSAVADWWSGLFGKGNVFDPEEHFIVCANVLGSCYGSTGPRSIDPVSGQPYGLDFPRLTIRDWAKAHDVLRQHLGIEKIELCIGGSCGGHQALELTYLIPERVRQMAILVGSARETAWAIAGHEAQRMAIEADPTFFENKNEAGKKGLKAARGMALLGYRTFENYVARQTDTEDKLDELRASGYIRYQGQKLEHRFYAHSYWHMTKILDTHNLGRGRGGVAQALSEINVPALIISVDSDLLIPPAEQKSMAAHLPQATLCEIHSDFGHDGFLVEVEKIRKAVSEWRNGMAF